MTLIDRAIMDIENAAQRLDDEMASFQKLRNELKQEARYLRSLRDDIRTDIAAVTAGGIAGASRT